MSSFTSLASSLVYAKFLGLEERILICGNNRCHSQLQLLVMKEPNPSNLSNSANNIDSSKDFVSYAIVNNVNLPNSQLCSCEIGSIPSTSSCFVAFASFQLDKRLSIISIASLESTMRSTDIQVFPMQSTEYNGRYTSLAYNSDQGAIAIATEDGRILVYGIESGQQIASYIADAAGVNRIQFSKSGQIITSGKSFSSCPLKVWDLRSRNISILGDVIPSQEYKQNLSRNESGEYVCMTNHPVHEQVVCGSSNGTVSIWDFRSGSQISFKPHCSKVTDIAFDPRCYDKILTSSNDGTVKKSNIQHSSYLKDISVSGQGGLYSMPYETLACMETEGSAYMTCLDTTYGRDMYSKSKCLAGSSIGGLWTVEL